MEAYYNNSATTCCVINYGDTSTSNIISCLDLIGISYHIISWEDSVYGEHRCTSPYCIISGGPLRVCKGDNRYNISDNILGKRILAICYGMQILCWNAGGKISHLQDLQRGLYTKYMITEPFSGADTKWWQTMEYIRRDVGWYNRLDYVESVPEDVIVLSLDTTGLISSCYILGYNAYCVHNHPESPKCLDLDLISAFFEL